VPALLTAYGGVRSQNMNLYSAKYLFFGIMLFSQLVFPSSSTNSPAEQLGRDVDSKEHTFLTWYNGWGQHSVWGVGKVGACFTCGSVTCGNTKITFTVTYDSHTRSGDSKYPQSQEYASEYNTNLLAYFKIQKQECSFEFISETDSTASNK